jgi:hypothetical protein
MIWSFSPDVDVDVDAISEALSTLHLGTDEGQPPRVIAREVPKAKRRQPVSHMTTGGPMASLRPQYVLIRL